MVILIYLRKITCRLCVLTFSVAAVLKGQSPDPQHWHHLETVKDVVLGLSQDLMNQTLGRVLGTSLILMNPPNDSEACSILGATGISHLGAKGGPPPAFVNKALLEHNSFISCLELQQRPPWLTKPKYLLPGLYRKSSPTSGLVHSSGGREDPASGQPSESHLCLPVV